MAGRNLTVLVVDDNEINQLVSVEAVAELGYDVDVAENGEEAVERAKKGHYCLILMDCVMPKKDGFQATLEIREWERGSGRRVPIVALTAHGEESERRRAISSGMNDFVEKPLSVSTLEQVLRTNRVDRDRGTGAEPLTRTMPCAAPELTPDVARSEKLIRQFQMLVPQELEALWTSYREKDAPAVRAHAHKLKGSCLAIVAEPMAKLAQLLQFQAEDGDLSGAESLIGQLEASFSLVSSLLDAELED